MKHSSTRELHAYWNERRGARAAPERGDIEPGAIRKALGDTFILASDPTRGYAFRLAGTRVCALFGRELRGESFAALWDRAGRAAVRELLSVVAGETTGIVAGASGRTAERFAADLELVLLPLAHRGQSHTRMIGALAPLAAPLWLGASRLEWITLGHLRHLAPSLDSAGAPRFVAAPGRIEPRSGLVVYPGGRA
jgi:hypothetical protein